MFLRCDPKEGNGPRNGKRVDNVRNEQRAKDRSRNSLLGLFDSPIILKSDDFLWRKKDKERQCTFIAYPFPSRPSREKNGKIIEICGQL